MKFFNQKALSFFLFFVLFCFFFEKFEQITRFFRQVVFDDRVQNRQNIAT